MSVECIKSIIIKSDGVYLTSKSANDTLPFQERRCDSLSKVYEEEGQKGLDREALQMLCEYARVSPHPSMAKYAAVLKSEACKAIHAEFIRTMNDAYAKLNQGDKMSLHRGMPDRATPSAMEYKKLEQKELRKKYEALAELCEGVVIEKPAPQERVLLSSGKTRKSTMNNSKGEVT